jgi:hypothetical protein
MEAAKSIAKHAEDVDRVSFGDLFECLRRGYLAAEIGAAALGARLGIPVDWESWPRMVDVEYWRDIIESNKQ